MLKRSHPRARHAFTLIELSILLVIIALVVGGVMVGRDLIESARLKNVISTGTEIEQTIHTFKLKYNNLPGDIPNATAFGLTQNGNGDGKMNEEQYIFSHLRQAGLLNCQCLGETSTVINNNGRQAYNFPVIPLDVGVYGIFEGTYSPSGGAYGAFVHPRTMAMANTAAMGRHGATWLPPFSPVQAKMIDAKIDDGLPTKGAVTGYAQSSGDPYTYNDWGGTPQGNMVQPYGAWCYSGTNYYLMETRKSCGLMKRF